MTTEERNKFSFIAPLPIGFTLFSCHLFAVRYTNSSINPARAFATSLVSREFTKSHWIYWIGMPTSKRTFERRCLYQGWGTLWKVLLARNLIASICSLGPFTGGITAAALYIFFCYFDFDIVTAANKAQHRAEVAAGPGETVTVQVVSVAAEASASDATLANASSTAYEHRVGDTTVNSRKV